VIAALLLAYLPVWQAGFVWDDDLHLTANPHVLARDGLTQIWSSGAANYFPLAMTAYWALHALFGLNPLPYHLATLLLHAGCAVLLWRVLKRLDVKAAWLGAALWALHPVQAESVAWVSELKNTLSCVFFLTAVWCFLRWLEEKGPAGGGKAAFRFYGAAWLCALLAVLSKSSTVMLPVVLGLCWWWRERTWRWRDVRWLLPFLAISLLASGWTIWEQKYNSKATGAEWNQSLAERGVIAGKVVWFYLGKLLWPHPLVFIYPRWTITATSLTAWWPTVSAVAVLALLWWRRATTRAWFFAAAHFVVSLFPVLGFFDVYFFRFSFVGDHLQYLASIGVMAALGAGLATLAEKFTGLAGRRGMFAVGAVLLLGGLAALTSRQSKTYADAESLYRSILAHNPACWLAHNNLGILLIGSARREEGLAHYREAVRYKPDYIEAHFNLGTAALEGGQPTEAVEHFRVALTAARKDAATHNSLGVALQQLGRAAEALPYLETAVRLDPNLAPAHYNLANARYGARRYAEAVEHYEASLRLMAGQPNAQNNLGLALQQLGRLPEAAARFEAALKLRPGYEEALFNLANARADLGELAAALPRYEAVLRLKPDFAEAHNNFGNALLRSHRLPEAIAHYEEALRLIPGYVEAHNNLASALYQAGRREEAVTHLETALRLDPTSETARNNLAQLRAMRQTERPQKQP
jgi:tetratricopeptide (TPR) repeat protein